MNLLALALSNGAAFSVDLDRGVLLLAPIDTEETRLRPPSRGEVVATSADHQAVLFDGGLEVWREGRRTRRLWLPSDWDLEAVTYFQIGDIAVARLGTSLVHTGGRGKRPVVYDFGSEGPWMKTSRGLVDLESGTQFVLAENRASLLAPFWFEAPQRFGRWWVGSHDDRAVVWDADGVIHVVTDTPDVGVHRISSDGSLLAVLTADTQVELWGLDGIGLWSRPVCLDANGVWPLDRERFVVRCGTELVLHDGEGTSSLDGRAYPFTTMEMREGEVVVRSPGRETTRAYPLSGGRGREVVTGGGTSVQGYRRGNAVRLNVTRIGSKPVEQATAAAFEKMKLAASSEGLHLSVVSGFRTWDEQEHLYHCYLTKRCNNGNLAARPGYSHHQSGKALDVRTDPGVVDWLRENAKSFGFYETVRGEPWHWEFHGASAPIAMSVADLMAAEIDAPLPGLPGARWRHQHNVSP